MSDNLHTTALDFERGIYALVGEGAAGTIAPNAAAGCEYTDALTGDFWKMRTTGWTLIGTASGSGSADWSNITNRPTTRDGYGLTDVWTSAQSDNRYLSNAYVPSWGSISGKPTTLGGYGITDAYTQAASDGRYLQLTGGTLTGSLKVTGGQVRATGWYTAGGGPSAVEIGDIAGEGYVISYDRDNTVFKPLNLGGSAVNAYQGGLYQQGVNVGKAIWQTGALNTNDPAPASGAGTIKYQVV